MEELSENGKTPKITRPSQPSSNSKVTLFKSLSVEPAGFLVIVSVVISHLIFQNLLMETICRVGKISAINLHNFWF